MVSSRWVSASNSARVIFSPTTWLTAKKLASSICCGMPNVLKSRRAVAGPMPSLRVSCNQLLIESLEARAVMGISHSIIETSRLAARFYYYKLPKFRDSSVYRLR